MLAPSQFAVLLLPALSSFFSKVCQIWQIVVDVLAIHSVEQEFAGFIKARITILPQSHAPCSLVYWLCGWFDHRCELRAEGRCCSSHCIRFKLGDSLPCSFSNC